MSSPEMTQTITQLLQAGKGILAADETPGNIGKKLESLHIENTAENRRRYRELLFTTLDIEDYISGVILQDETICQSTASGTPFTQILSDKNILFGIKVDLGLTSISDNSSETVTQGLSDLSTRLKEYKKLGATFAKWRAVIHINDLDGLPSTAAIERNANDLAEYAKRCQDHGIVPIVEPEVLMDGTHTIDTTFKVTQSVLASVFNALSKHNVVIQNTLLKPNMVISGLMCAQQSTPATVAEQTIKCFQNTLPTDLPGVVFLSGGQSDTSAIENLAFMNQNTDLSWTLSFSYGRALQRKALVAWGGQDVNLSVAQQAFLEQAQACSKACFGKL